ncbi:hypothetical protein AVEN_110946-1 [Araneus ventricosus]|uniref:Uncharacterized protein n=1 Tax=Araneus ventricosus TaxID=182803 RepID=A0A4Y2HDB7_ARAVE|nr:hypothetical protein AVEN_110946-1 [Araneus ventricosus]
MRRTTPELAPPKRFKDVQTHSRDIPRLFQHLQHLKTALRIQMLDEIYSNDDVIHDNLIIDKIDDYIWRISSNFFNQILRHPNPIIRYQTIFAHKVNMLKRNVHTHMVQNGPFPSNHLI